jgi:hypothetical protein
MRHLVATSELQLVAPKQIKPYELKPFSVIRVSGKRFVIPLQAAKGRALLDRNRG